MIYLENIIDITNTFLWSYILVALLISVGIYFSIRTRFAQVKYFKNSLSLLFQKSDPLSQGISPFKAFCISTASKIGTGNIAGVAIAISLGGPGAVFWMWIIAIIGAASSFVECTLAQIYKVPDGDGFRGGPSYYMERALGNRKLGVAFSILIMLSFGLAFNSVQSNTVSFAFEEAFGFSRFWIGLILCLATSLVIFGGISRISAVSGVLVPIMASIYISLAVAIVILNIDKVPAMVALIVRDAFGLREFVGGGMGSALVHGIRRGLFSNEAGMGSAPNAAATSNVSHPVKQGLVQSLGVFVDTMVVCSATAFIILLSDAHLDPSLQGIQITQLALSSHIGALGSPLIALAILLFSFSSIVGNYYYGETNIMFIDSTGELLSLYRLGVILMVMFGAIADVSLVWNIADIFMGSMAIMNLIAILLLSNVSFKALSDYKSQIESGKDPQFVSTSIEGLENLDYWD